MFTFTNQLIFVNITKNMKKLFLIDAYAMIYRSYFAFSKNPRFNSDGFETSAIYGFVNSIIELLSNEGLTHLGVVFDTPKKTHRHIQYVEYKANRDAMPEGISGAIPYIKNILAALNIPILFVDDYEDITYELLEQFLNNLDINKLNIEKLNLNYWINEINSVSISSNEKFTSNENPYVSFYYKFKLDLIKSGRSLIKKFKTINRKIKSRLTV